MASSLKRSIKQKIVFLVVLFITSFAIVIVVENTFHILTRNYQESLRNQSSRSSLGKIILKKLILIELDLNKIVSTNPSKEFDNLEEKIRTSINDIEGVLNILRNGGTFNEVLPANFADITEINEQITFKRDKTKDYVIGEIIDLTPQIKDTKRIAINLIKTLRKKAEFLNERERLNVRKETSLLLNQVQSILMRSQEIANKIFYDTNLEIQYLERQKKESIRSFSILRTSIFALIAIIGSLLFIRILFQIGKILREHTDFANKLQEANQNVEKILETLPVGVLIMDTNEKIQKTNSAAVELLDASSPEELIDKEISTIFTNNKKTENEAELLTITGEKLLVMKSSISLKIQNEFVTIEAFMDITEARRSREELEQLVDERTKEITEANQKIQDEINERKQLQIQLLQSEKMSALGQLAAAIAHEINNPIGFINANLNSAENYLEKIMAYIKELETINIENQEQINQYQEKYKIDFIRNDFNNLIKESEEGTERVRKIVGELKKFIYKDNQEELLTTNINKEIESTLNIVWNELRYKAEIIKEFDPDLPEIPCYAQQFNQVFMNILLNAGQAIKEKGIIKIKTYKEDSNINIIISDNGQGISQEHLKQIFDPFFTTKEAGEGTGLGLSIANDIIKRHGGEMTVKSSSGKGTTFTMTIPIKNNAKYHSAA